MNPFSKTTWAKRLPQIAFWLGISSNLCMPLSAWGSDDSVVAVLSSNSAPYQQAFKGLQRALGHPIPSYNLANENPQIPSTTRVIIALGGKAALYRYPSGTMLIYALAPGTKVRSDDHSGPVFLIQTTPAANVAVAKFKEIQPSLKRLAIIWAGDSIESLFDAKKDIVQHLGVELISDRVQNSADLPDHLRALKGKVDAIWLPADAAMVTPKNFITLKGFSISNGIPFYVPSDALVEQGGLASVNASFEDIGVLAAQVANQALSSGIKSEDIFPEKTHFTINLTTAKSCNLKISSTVQQSASTVFP